MSRFTNKVIIVTGGASGIGEASVALFANEGAKTVIADLSKQGQIMADALNQAGKPSLFIPTDVSDSTAVQQMIQQTVAQFGRIDILFANAGIAADAHITRLDEMAWKRTIDINLTGVYLCNKYAIEQMLKQNGGGIIVNCGSIHSHVGKEGVTAYAAAKGGVKLLTQTLAIDYAAKGIRINAVCPGYIDTPLLSHLPPEAIKELEKRHPQGRLGTAREVANAVAFLASDDASFVNGSCLMVDGGYTAQ